jgi:hypothetical protein
MAARPRAKLVARYEVPSSPDGVSADWGDGAGDDFAQAVEVVISGGAVADTAADSTSLKPAALARHPDPWDYWEVPEAPAP